MKILAILMLSVLILEAHADLKPIKQDREIKGGLGYTLGNIATSKKVKCQPPFRNFKECEIKVTPRSKKIYLIQSVYVAPTNAEAQKEFTITVESIKEMYVERKQTPLRKDIPLRKDYTYVFTKSNKKISCIRSGKTVILTYMDEGLLMQARKEEREEQNKKHNIKDEVKKSDKGGLL